MNRESDNVPQTATIIMGGEAAACQTLPRTARHQAIQFNFKAPKPWNFFHKQIKTFISKYKM